MTAKWPVLPALLIASVSFGGADSMRQQAKAAWDWTVDERLAARLETVSPTRGKRIVAAAAGTSQGGGGGFVTATIDGRKNPELFLPHELFDALLTGFMADESLRAKQRGLYWPLIPSLGHDDEQFWSILQSLSSSYLPYRFGSRTGSKQDVAEWTAAKCRERYRALETARTIFGRRDFDRLLYVVVAPTAQHSRAAS